MRANVGMTILATCSRRELIETMKNAIGYESPQEGKADKGGSYTVWVQLPSDGKWYSPKDISGLRRDIATHEHVRVLKRDIKGLKVRR